MIVWMTRAMLGLSAVASMGLVWWIGHIEGVSDAIWGLGFSAWIIAPYVFIGRASYRHPGNRSYGVSMLVLTTLVCGLAAWIYTDAFFVHTDPQSGLVMLFIPLWQLLGSVLWVVVSDFAAKRGERIEAGS